MTNLELTIIVPIYNVEEYLEKCLNSLVDVRYMDRYSVILVDDCGQDSSRQIAMHYVDTYPNLFRLLQHEKNRGLSAARNTGLDYTNAPYVMFVDSDDWLSDGLCCVNRWN
ncbi:glycosyltransferase family 2 protein [Vibrio alfacsensis]|uniref:glycosyltransferase family 2 protein n=1 Tax=Vibrio alfacsensis TaxID=1074311 RepID=UPI004068B4F2